MIRLLDRLKRCPPLTWAGGATALVLVLMFALAPYQHGDLGEGSQRQSVAGGLLHMVNTDAEWLYCPAVPLLAASCLAAAA